MRCMVLAAMAVLMFSEGAALAQSEDGFKMPSRNIYCILEQAGDSNPVTDLRCDIQQTSNRMPAPPQNCPFSWGDAFSITPQGASGQRICHGDTTKNDDLPELAYGSIWQKDGLTCTSLQIGLTCTNARGHGFSLSRASQRVF